MELIRRFRITEFLKNHSVILGIGLLTSITIILFQMVSLFVIFGYLKLDYYLFLVAFFFLVTGILLNSRYKKPLMPKESRENLLDLLSSKETTVLQMVYEGKSNKEIATALFIELSTVKTHVNHIYSKISVNNRKEARKKYSELSGK